LNTGDDNPGFQPGLSSPAETNGRRPRASVLSTRTEGATRGMFRRLLWKIILERAIAFEERAYRFYEEALGRSALSDTSDLLRQLLAEELMHRMKLEEMQRTGGLGLLEVSLPRAVQDIEDFPLEWPALHPWAHKGEVLETALRMETKAYRFYKSLAKKAALKAARDVFCALSFEESAHVERLKNAMEKVSR
jgi:rubrerythrin